MSALDPLTTITAIAGPTGNIGASFYFHPATIAASKEMGLDGFKMYILGRGGVLGDVPASVVAAAFGYFNPAVIAGTWEKAKSIVPPLTAAQAYFDMCGAVGRDAFADIDEAVLTAYVDAADVVIASASPAGLPLYAGIADLTCADDAPACAIQKAAVLRELRGSAHLCAVLACGLTDAQAHAIKRPGDVAMFGWEEAPATPIDGNERMDAAEAATNVILAPAFSALTDEQAAALIAGTEAMAAALGV